MSINHLNKEALEDIAEKMWIAHGSLKGLAALFTQGSKNSCFESKELYGIGQLLKKISEDLEKLEDRLRSGDGASSINKN
jgi:hypothetical protein